MGVVQKPTNDIAHIVMSTIAHQLSDSKIKLIAPQTSKVNRDEPASIAYTRPKWQFFEYRTLLYYYLYDEAHIGVQLCSRSAPPTDSYKLFSIYTEEELTKLEAYVEWWLMLQKE